MTEIALLYDELSYNIFMKKRVFRIAAYVLTVTSVCLVAGAVALCIIFPNRYAREAERAAAEYGLSASLVKSVVWAESRFDPYATSSKGAKGLMQLMPETFDAVKAQTGIDGDIYDPVTSLRCGCYYLSFLIDRFDGNETAALMAYNAGESNARRFLAGEPVYPETKKYLDNIARARRVYSVFN